MSKFYNYFLTYFPKNIEGVEFEDELEQLKISVGDYTWLGWVKETCPSTGRIHLHVIWGYKNQRSFKNVMKPFEGKGKLEPLRGSLKQNEKYLNKENKWIKEGEWPKQGDRTDLNIIRSQIDKLIDNKGSIDDILLSVASESFTTYSLHRKAMTEYYEMKKSVKRDYKTKVIVLWGESGTGKSREAFENGATNLEYDGKFFSGELTDTMVLDDFDCLDMGRKMFLNICDRYPLKVRVLGGYKEWCVKTLYITSNYDPANWYGGDKAVQRRLDVVKKMT